MFPRSIIVPNYRGSKVIHVNVTPISQAFLSIFLLLGNREIKKIQDKLGEFDCITHQDSCKMVRLCITIKDRGY
jgi:hypothetical protein